MTDDNIPSNSTASDDASPVKPAAKSTDSAAPAKRKPSSSAKARRKAAPDAEGDSVLTPLEGEQASKPATKKTAAKKPAASKSAAKTAAKPAVKKTVKKAAAEKTPVKKAPAIETTAIGVTASATTTTTEATTTEAATVKTTAAKAPAKKPAARKSTAKPATSKPAAAKKAPAKKTAVKKSPAKASTTDTAIPTTAAPATDHIEQQTPGAVHETVVIAPAVSAAPEAATQDRASAVNATAPSTQPTNKPASAGLDKDFLLNRARVYWRLARMDKPIGALLLLWPTLWALWLAAEGFPRWDLLVIFVLGVFVMRAAGCVINDFADRKVDGHVKRTQGRPLATGEVSSREAVAVFIALCLVAFGLVLLTDKFTIYLSVGGLLLAFCYPFMKRHTHLPQVVLGAAFAWGIPMAFAAQSGAVGPGAWLLYTTVVLWTVVYDTFYAMVDRDDDLRIGVKSTAILFGEQDRVITAMLQAFTIYALTLVGSRFELGGFYYAGVTLAAALFVYQQYLIRFRARNDCFKAFMNNNWVGAAVFAGIVLNYAL